MKLLTQFQFKNGLILNNRIVMAPMTRLRANDKGVLPDISVTYYQQRASAGLIITECAQISDQGRGYAFSPGIHTDAQKIAWGKVVQAVHAAGGKIFLQIWHTGRISHPLIQKNASLPVAPSPIAAPGTSFTPDGAKPFPVPLELTHTQINDIVGDFAAATQSAREIGFDGVEIHGAFGYLVDQFLQDISNHRGDRYGGTIENRARFALEVVHECCKTWPGHVGIKLSPKNRFQGMGDSNPSATFGYLVTQLNRFPMAYVHVMESSELRPHFSGNFIINCGYTRDQAEATIQSNAADLVSFGIPFIANPDLPHRFRINAPLAIPDKTTFYMGGEKGYITYPALITR